MMVKVGYNWIEIPGEASETAIEITDSGGSLGLFLSTILRSPTASTVLFTVFSTVN